MRRIITGTIPIQKTGPVRSSLKSRFFRLFNFRNGQVLNYRKKYAEGYLCQDCYYKLSPWFQLSDNTPGQVLGAQFSYREANRTAVAAFHPNRSYGFFLGYNETSERRNLRVYHRLLIDDSARKFAMHLPGTDENTNPDILDFSQIAGCEFTEEYKKKKTEGDDGKRKTVLHYTFHFTIHVYSPYFNAISINAYCREDLAEERRKEGAWMKAVIDAAGMAARNNAG